MWGPSIVGFVRYLYRYDSGREGESMLTGSSPRKSNWSCTCCRCDDLAALDKHKIARSCRYINKLADVDLDVHAKIVTDTVARVRRDCETFDR